MELVIDPLAIPSQFPVASLSNPLQLRILAQIVQYNSHKISLTIQSIPTICPNPRYLTVSLQNIPPSQLKLTQDGQLIQVYAIYDSKKLTVFKIEELSVEGLNDPKLIETLVRKASLFEELNPGGM